MCDAKVPVHHDIQRCRNRWEEMGSRVGLSVKDGGIFYFKAQKNLAIWLGLFQKIYSLVVGDPCAMVPHIWNEFTVHHNAE